MASNKNLKKTMQLISSELIATVFYKALVSEKNIDKEADALVIEISQFTREFISRIGKYGGKDSKQIKAYYRKLYADWDNEITPFIDRYEAL